MAGGQGPGRVLVAGVSGVVGFAAARRFAAQGWEVLGLSRRKPDRLPSEVRHLAVDLADPASVAAVAGDLAGVTHLMYAALYEKPGLYAGWREHDQMERNRLMLANLFEPLAAGGALRHVSLLQGTKAYGAHIHPITIPARERQPRDDHENFYWLQEDHLRAAAAVHGFRFTIFRPQLIFGDVTGADSVLCWQTGYPFSVNLGRGYPRYNPGPNAVRSCTAHYVQEYRPSGTVITPRMNCYWRPG